MSANTDIKDKLVLDPTESKDLTEFFGRLNPGDEVSGKFKATLDEAGQKTICLSIQDIEFDKPDDENENGQETASDEGEEDDEEGEKPDSAAVEMYKNEDGVSAGEGNNPPEVMPSH